MAGKAFLFSLSLAAAIFGWWLGEDVSSPVAKLFRLALLLTVLVALGIYLALGRDNKPVGVACMARISGR
jgi:hypothetical protein